MNSQDQNLPRDFKGIWIPREIWLHTELSYFEKALWAEIDSLDRPEEGCTASNDYLCKFFNEKVRCLQSGLAKLKKLKLIKIESFDGRRRILRSCLKTTHAIFDTPGVQNPAWQTCQILHPSPIGGCIERENKEENKEEIYLPPLPPPSQAQSSSSTPAPTREEEEEISKRFKQRPKEAPTIVSMKRWRKEVLLDLRITEQQKKVISSSTEKHRACAQKFDGCLINGDRVCALKDKVEFTCGSSYKEVRYDITDAEWESQTSRWFKNG